MTENREATLRRIQKLLAIATDDRANPNETAAAAGMAEKIMRKYQFEQSEVIMTALKVGDDLGMSESIASAKTNGTKMLVIPPWVRILAVAVARFNDCETRSGRTVNGEACLRFYGFSADVQIAKYMFDYLCGTVNRLCNEFKKTDQYLIEGRRAVNSYRQGVSTGIISILKSLTKEKAEEAAKQTTGTALVVIKKNAIAAKFGGFGYTNQKRTLSSTSAFSNGVADGKKVDVTRRAVNAPNSSILIGK